jgi:hypothetical protein
MLPSCCVSQLLGEDFVARGLLPIKIPAGKIVDSDPKIKIH